MGESLENLRENWEFVGENIGSLLEKILGVYWRKYWGYMTNNCKQKYRMHIFGIAIFFCMKL